MKKTTTLSLVLALLIAHAIAQQDKDTPGADPNIRPAKEVVLKFERKIEIPQIRRLSDEGVLELFPGDTVHLEFEDEGGNLIRPRVVAKVQHPKRTISFTMKQDEQMTSLSRSTKIQKTVAIDCVHRGLGSEEFFRTNLYPTEKGLAAYDSWPNSVWMLRLSNIEVTSTPAAEVYKERVSQGSPAEETNGKPEAPAKGGSPSTPPAKAGAAPAQRGR